MFSIALDADAKTRERRELLLKTAKRYNCRKALMTNYPHEEGMKFVNKLRNETGMDITLAERKSISKKNKEYWKSIGVLAVDRVDIINLIPTDKYDLLDLDFCGGLFRNQVEAIEANNYWKIIFLKISNKPRDKAGKLRAIPKGIHIQEWINGWCQKNGWYCQVNPIPYMRGSKGLWFYSFVLRRD